MDCNSSEVSISHWPDGSEPTEFAIQRKLKAAGLSAYGWGNGPGDEYPAHSHSYNKVIYVVSGEITFGLPGLNQRHVLKAGDRLYLPKGTEHSAMVGNAGVYCLAAHC